MAIKKSILMDNGLTLEYHRIAMVKIDINSQITLLVYSYLNEDSREMEYKLNENNEPIFPYYDYEYINFDYDDTINTKRAYELLKTLPKFQGAEDV